MTKKKHVISPDERSILDLLFYLIIDKNKKIDILYSRLVIKLSLNKTALKHKVSTSYVHLIEKSVLGKIKDITTSIVKNHKIEYNRIKKTK